MKGNCTQRVKILDSEKIISSYIHRRDEKELWSLNFEGWVILSEYFTGGNAEEVIMLVTFEEVFKGSASDENCLASTWAAVLRSGSKDSNED